MLAMVLESPRPVAERPLVARRIPDPEPGPDEIVLRVLATAVCRTDLQIASGEVLPRRLPVVPGHQVVGIVERVGSAVNGWRPGDKAGVAWLAGACGRCRFCRSARENLCLQAEFTGWDRNGGYAELIAVRAGFALLLPEAFQAVEAAPLLCGGVIGYRALKRSGIEPGGKLGLFGYGASAHLAIQVARHWGCEVYVCTRSAREQQRAIAAGARWAGGYDQEVPERLDAAVTFAPAGEVVVAALRSLDRGGTVAVNAIHLDRVPQFDYQLLWWERNLSSVANFTRQDAREFLELAATIPVRTQVQVFSLDEANEALARHESGALDGTAVLVPASV